MTTQERVNEHLQEAFQYFPKDRVVAICLQGSQNYGLDIPGSDVDTKLIITPTFEEVAFNRKPHSTTHVRENNEHIDFKDIRLMLQTFRKQNLNFVEILFTQYKWEHPLYQEEWQRLVGGEREAIARYCPYQAVKTMKGIAMEKYHAMEHEYPSKVEVLAKYGYDPKQVSHLVRVYDFINEYVKGRPYEDCLRPPQANFIRDIKLGKYNLEQARDIAQVHLNKIITIADDFCEQVGKEFNQEAENLLNDVQYNIMKIAIKEEMM